MKERTLKERLARYMDPQAFEPVATPAKRTSPEFAHRQAEKRKVRREIAMKRAECAIRFFCKPDNLWLLNDRAAAAPASVEASSPALTTDRAGMGSQP